MKKFFLPILLLISLLGLSLVVSCEVGMGEALDLEAPEVTVTAPAKFSYQHLSFRFEGTCKDNEKVTSVVISNKVTGKVYGNAIINGDNWYYDITLAKEEEGENTFLIQANDAYGNSSTRSSRIINLLVDENAPEAKSWYIDRGNSIQTQLEPQEFLEGLDYTLAVNKNYPQNQKFTLYGDFYDAMGIDTITVKLFEVGGSDTIPVITKTVDAKSDAAHSHYIGDGKSIYSPEFEFTHDELVSAKPTLNSGKHYLRVTYYAKDNDDPQNYNDREVSETNVILWWPESDRPGIQQISEKKDGKIRIGVGSSIPVDFFDDDGLAEVYYSLKDSITGTIESYTESLISNSSTRSTAFTNAANQPAKSKTDFPMPPQATSFQTDYNTDIVAPETPKSMYLIAAAKDIYGKWNARVIPVEVTDSSKPMLFVESPTENEYPVMKTGSTQKFKFTGYSLDTSGSDYIKIAYIPEGGEARGKELLDLYASNTDAKKTFSNGEVIWYKKITGSNVSDGWNKQLFEIEMDLLNDFKNASGETTANLDKFFEIRLVDTEGNLAEKPFRLSGDSLPPSIEIVEPATELKVHDYTVDDLVIKFRGFKASGIGMKTSAYKLETKIGSDEIKYVTGTGSGKLVVGSDGYASITISKATLAEWAKTESQPTFTFYATDMLGNGDKGEGLRSVILSPKPVVQAITVNKNSGTYKKGDVLEFKVTFSKQVKVTGTPKLKIKYSSTDSTPKYAVYDSGDNSNALTFKWTVPEDAVSDGIICDGFALDTSDPTKPDTLADGATIKATELGEGNIYTSLSKAEVLKGKVIKLDGVAPRITGITIESEDGNNYCTKDKVITATLSISEKVLVSGSPYLVLYVGSTPVKFEFEKLENSTTTGTLTFVHKVKSTGTDKTPQGTIKYALTSCFSNSDKVYVTDVNGNIIDLNKNTGAADSSVIVDYTAPANAPSVNIAAGIYNTLKTLELSNIETNADAYYSLNDGASWTKYNSSSKPELGDGTYKISTYQQDKAGNQSVKLSPVEVSIISDFAPVTNFSVDLGDGNYKQGTEFTFTLNFGRKVVINNATDAQLTFVSDSDSSKTKTINVTVPSGKKTDAVTFEYTVSGTDEFSGIKVTQIEFSSTFKDENGNSPAFATTARKLTPTNCSYLAAEDGGYRKNIVLDGVAPTIVTYSPASQGISTITDNSQFKIELTFSEAVYPEAGTIILQRKTGWAIPPVLDSPTFLKYYNMMSDTNKDRMMLLDTSTGKEKLHSQTGIALGPYRKITHGLTVKNGKYVPDEATKYVLAYQLGLYDGSASLDGTTVTVANIRAALESVGYHQHKVDVSSGYITQSTDKKTVTITFAETIEDGQEWELIIPPKAFRDNTENFYKGMNLQLLSDTSISNAQKTASDKYSMWSNNVAKPVVRVDRYTHGWGAKGKNGTDITVNNGKYKNTRKDNSAAKIAPLGTCNVRIDCETPGASILYSKLGNTGTAYTTTVPAGIAYNAANGTAENTNEHTNTRHTVADISSTQINKRGTQSYTAGSDIVIGDGNYTDARKDYITAYAQKTGFVDSANGYEGIFKTIVYIKSNGQVNCINIEGGTAPGGQPNVDGFPLRDATSEKDPNGAGRYSKNCYVIDGDTRKTFVFVSYEIISNNWAILLCNANHSTDYPLNDYGGTAYITKQNFWTGSNITE